MNHRDWTDRRIENIVGNLLRAGVLTSAALVATGALIFLVRHGGAMANFRMFHGEPSDYRTVRGILSDSFALQGRGIIQLGLLLLIATPVARVAFTIFGFAEENDRLYMAVASFVLLILLYSLLGS